ncbi:uncharacterized protein [Apostichopus japonicus]|uniref:uncharacterized protein isoform X1 n=1 Tax=Stichopus japonicus TaxID=307972 RepID=UPI003AB550DA
MDDSDWWKKNPCPLHPDWGLQDISDLDHTKLKLHIETDDNAKREMMIEANIYRAFLESPNEDGTLYNRSRNSPSRALDYLQQAEDIVVTSCDSEEAITGYGVVINTFRMWLRRDSSVESTLKELEDKKNKFPKYEAYVTIVHAYILAWLGPRWRTTAMVLYGSALKHFPKNSQWLFGLALMYGREARHQRGVIGWNCPLPQDIMTLLHEEKQILQQVLSIDPSFHLARAHYGQVLFNLDRNSQQAEGEFKKAFKLDHKNCNIGILAARFYRHKGQFSKAENVLKKLIEEVNLAEVHAQLGFLYRTQSYREKKENRSMLQEKALKCFEKAVELDRCHYPALVGIGEMQAMLGNEKEARFIYEDLFESDFKDQLYQESNEYRALTSAIKLNVFTPLEHITFSHRIIQLAVGLTADGDHIITVPPSSLDETKNRCIATFEQYITESGGDLIVARQAKLKLANANLLLGNIEDAQTQYEKLYDDSIIKGEPPQVEVIFGRGKCYLRSDSPSKESDGKAWANVIQMAEELKQTDACCLSDELYADVYMAKARLSTGDDNSTQLKLAIHKGSLEACYRYILSLQELQANFFNDISIPETLQEVKRVCSVGKPLHTQFTVILDDGSKVVHNLTTKKNFIQTAVDRVVNYDINITQTIENERLQTVLDKLRQLREYRMKYELELRLSRETNTWGKLYAERFLDVVELAKRLLDKCISACQDLVIDNPPRFSLFQVVFDGKAGNVEKERCTREVTSWAKKKVKLPEYLLEKITKIQPMYDKNNMWLWAIHHLDNWRKHSAARCDIGETFTIELDSDPKFATLKTDDIVKDSCKGVVNLVVDLLNTCCEKLSGASTVAGDV